MNFVVSNFTGEFELRLNSQPVWVEFNHMQPPNSLIQVGVKGWNQLLGYSVKHHQIILSIKWNNFVIKTSL